MLAVMDPDAGGALPGTQDSNEQLLARVATGDKRAFAQLYDATSSRLFGLARRLLVDPAQAEEVTQEVFVEVWRTATRFDARKGSARTWILMLAHRRAVDRVRSAQASSDREDTVAARNHVRVFDEVAEQAELRLEQQQVRRCLGSLTEVQRESVTLAFYGGYTYPEVAKLLGAPLGTVKTRMRDGLIRLRDCLGVIR
jgi:RNA polymerase sigma-70 factor (ECF subfamily)